MERKLMIGQELNVSTILEGSIRLAGQKMRITAQLIDVVEDFHFWSETFDRSIDDIFEVQDEISLLIADKLREHLGHFEIEDRLIDTPNIPIEELVAPQLDNYKFFKFFASGERDLTVGLMPCVCMFDMFVVIFIVRGCYDDMTCLANLFLALLFAFFGASVF